MTSRRSSPRVAGRPPASRLADRWGVPVYAVEQLAIAGKLAWEDLPALLLIEPELRIRNAKHRVFRSQVRQPRGDGSTTRSDDASRSHAADRRWPKAVGTGSSGHRRRDHPRLAARRDTNTRLRRRPQDTDPIAGLIRRINVHDRRCGWLRKHAARDDDVPAGRPRIA